MRHRLTSRSTCARRFAVKNVNAALQQRLGPPAVEHGGVVETVQAGNDRPGT